MQMYWRKRNQSDEDFVITDDESKHRTTGRRREDTVVPINQDETINMDRRVANSDRRVSTDNDYNGPARRYNIDRRMSLKDRRDKG